MTARLATNAHQRLMELGTALQYSDVPPGHQQDLTFAMTFGKQGYTPPWPRDPTTGARWQIQQIQQSLRMAEVFVLSPAAHAAVMAAAATLEPADVVTLDRDRDIVSPTGLLVLPEPVILINRGGTASDTIAYSWQFVTQNQVLPTAQYPGVQITTYMDRDGPVQPAEWRMLLAQARANRTPLPPFVPDGIYGLRGDAAAESTERLASINGEHRRVNELLNEVSKHTTAPPEVGEWAGGQIEDTYDDFAARYMFAFWRLTTQGVTVATSARYRQPGSTGQQRKGAPAAPAVRVIRLAHQVPAQRGESDEAAVGRVYHHRWPVRMHKVRQWYPSKQEHRVIWRGPYIKGPADAPLMVGEKAYSVDT
ncbi:hypothetical protein [Streptomyces cavernicola]|uniref:Uncharacterized protein n=1 Tax=Streptomyces cavernicola TaxID=3043613 RepID=A0ABT6SJI3_9ACTN|nr:hypothetical protein [Streptomyces sp. B-S-A6]MDI3408362.1 hypothetical protein [Streptomyces sp. B-S-A6]